MTDEIHGLFPTTSGTEAEIINALNRRRTGLNPLAVAIAERHVREGDRAVELAGERYEIRDAEWSVEQDVYGCEDGRSCPDVTLIERERFEAIIANRLEDRG
ncbi:hypothetical protein [Catenulispora pinisilvae]|uniref:hypothetical protein n=1 Tax=Catenulispora pinisilvae TaxID=2705253 RepID=UPI0018925FB3|nr:hypothetical protein [Catenulispora pinisilvae]